MYSYCMFMYLHRASWHSSATLIKVFPFFLLSCKANSWVKPAKMGARPVPFQTFCVVLCTVLQSTGDYPIAVNKYIIYQTYGSGFDFQQGQEFFSLSYIPDRP